MYLNSGKCSFVVAMTIVVLIVTSACGSSLQEDPIASGQLVVVVNESGENGYLLREDDGDYVRLGLDSLPPTSDDRDVTDWRTAGETAVDVFGTIEDDGSIAVRALRTRATGGVASRTSSLVTRGGRRALALRVTFDGGATMGTAAQVTANLNNTAVQLAGASFDQMQLTFDVAGPYNITFGSCNDYGRWMSEAKAAASSAGYILAGYQHFMVIGNMDCGYGGLGAQPGSEIWLAGLWTEVTAHELGHNFGLFHATSRACTNAAGVAVPMSDVCTSTEYGDPFDTMGSGGVHHFSSAYKSLLGWIPADQIRTASGDQTYLLGAMTAPSGALQLIRIRGAGGVTYALESRQTSSTDSYAATDPVTKGVLVRAFYGNASDANRSNLLDMVPGGTLADAALPVGSSYTFPGTSTTLTVQSVSSAGARIQINGAGSTPGGERLRAVSSGKCIGLDFGSNDSLTGIVQRPCNGGSDQDWLLVDAGNGYFNVKTAASGRCLDVLSASTADDAKLIIWSCTGGANQRWAVTATGSGYSLRAQHSGKCASVRAASGADGTPIVQATCSTATSQQFLRDGGEQLLNAHSVKCLGVEGGSTANAANAVQYSCDASSSLKWAFESMGNGAYALRNVASGLCLDVYGVSGANGAALVQWPCSGAANQLWQPVASGAGFALRSVSSGKCVDDFNLSTADGARMVQWECNGGAWQSFTRR